MLTDTPLSRAGSLLQGIFVRQKIWVNSQYRLPDSRIAAGSVSTHAINRLRMVFICNPPPLATMVPATPDDNTCVVDTGKPNMSAAPIVNIATVSAEAPWA